MLSDWPLGGRGGIWLPAPERERSKPVMAKPGNPRQQVKFEVQMASGKGQEPPRITYTGGSGKGAPASFLQRLKGPSQPVGAWDSLISCGGHSSPLSLSPKAST